MENLIAVLKAISNSALLEHINQILNPFPITGIQSIPSELPQLAISHLFCLLNLLWAQLHLSWIDSIRSTTMSLLNFTIWRLHVTILIILLGRLGCLSLTSSLSVLLCDPALQLIDSVLFQFLPH